MLERFLKDQKLFRIIIHNVEPLLGSTNTEINKLHHLWFAHWITKHIFCKATDIESSQ